MKKKIVFFDGDGILWHPKSTKRSKTPHWVYHDEKTKENPNAHLELVPNLVETLRKLKEKDIMLIILSANPHSREKANKMMKEKVEYFKIAELVDEVHATPAVMKAKGNFILDVLARHKLNKKDALMVGDTYLWDCKPANNVGVDSVLIDSEYRRNLPNWKRAKKVIKEIKDVLELI